MKIPLLILFVAIGLWLGISVVRSSRPELTPQQRYQIQLLELQKKQQERFHPHSNGAPSCNC